MPPKPETVRHLPKVIVLSGLSLVVGVEASVFVTSVQLGRGGGAFFLRDRAGRRNRLLQLDSVTPELRRTDNLHASHV